MRQMYYKVARGLSPLALLAMRLYSNLTNQPRARVMIINEDNEILLVKNVIDPTNWSLPGGGVERGETPLKAAQREVREELSLRLATSSLTFLAEYPRGTQNIPYRALVFTSQVSRRAVNLDAYQRYEIADVQWHPLERLPANFSKVGLVAMADLRK